MGPPMRPTPTPFQEFESVRFDCLHNPLFNMVLIAFFMLQEALLSLDRNRTDESLMAELTGQQHQGTFDQHAVPDAVRQVRTTRRVKRVLRC